MPVRFSFFNTYHCPPPPMSFTSSSTSSSSSGLYTPPISYPGLPGPTPFLPEHKAHANTLLAYSLDPILDYDLSLPPSSISTHIPGLSSRRLLEPAVYPPQRALTLITPHLPWDIPVRAAGNYVTVADVLHALYNTLRANITPREFAALGADRNKRRVTQAYVQRYERLRGRRRSEYREEKRQGVKRVDFLMECTAFMGISPVDGYTDLWQLNVS
ncbi:hypothetical protein FB45DRAFT_801563 [Roridomyces roridus]|uniref:DUF6699 domain-containing protein n=1 Tax=Roridomyces roridus TaxID=1738132 RepID=A0AAD7FFN4_9AGAR|nr:hypothetical protein FB45DRAFT_801563 [Roridomyces roridus]